MLSMLAVAILTLALPPESDVRRDETAPAARAEHVLVPGTRVRLTPPAGHEAGRGFLGYQWPESGSSLMVFEMPGSYVEVVKGFDARGLAKGGMKFVEASAAKFGDHEGRIVLVTQELQGTRFQKWIAIFGDAKRTVLLNAIYPAELAGDLPAALKACILAAEWDPNLEIDPFAALPWTLTRPEGLRFAGNVGAMLLYTEDGEIVQKEKPAAARLMVAPSAGEVEVGDPRSFAEERIRQLPFGKSVEIQSSSAFEAGGRKGWEIVAKARLDTERVDILVHQVLLVGEGEYHMFVSHCGHDQRDIWLPRFRAGAASWKLKKVPVETPK